VAEAPGSTSICPGEVALTCSGKTLTANATCTITVSLTFDRPVTVKTAVEYACLNYPNILKSQAQMRASRENVTVQKLNEYLPDSLLQYQEIMASHNKLSQIFYGSPVFPAVAGPGDASGLRSGFANDRIFCVAWRAMASPRRKSITTSPVIPICCNCSFGRNMIWRRVSRR